MRLPQLSLLLILLVGCRSVLDPAPYTPNTDTFVLNSGSPGYTSVNVLQFSTLKDAETKLQALSNGYASERNNLMRQQLIFDIPLIGLAIATVTTGIYHGSKDSTLGLGISAATIAGGRLYFGPQTKVTAYNTAAFALSCASSVAGEMANVQDTFGSRGDETAGQLAAHLDMANKIILTPSVSAADRANLLPARDQAQKALDDLSSALTTLTSSPTQLKTFANTIIKGATNKVVTGTQNLDAVLTLIRATPTTVPSPKQPGAPPPGAPPPGAPPPGMTNAELVKALQDEANTARVIAKLINDKWSTLAACTTAQ